MKKIENNTIIREKKKRFSFGYFIYFALIFKKDFGLNSVENIHINQNKLMAVR